MHFKFGTIQNLALHWNERNITNRRKGKINGGDVLGEGEEVAKEQ